MVRRVLMLPTLVRPTIRILVLIAMLAILKVQLQAAT
jgi:hypothetical protein